MTTTDPTGRRVESADGSKLKWSHLTHAVRVKTVYRACLVLAAGSTLIGISLPLRGMPETLLLAIGSTLVTSSVFSVIIEAMLRLDLLEEFRAEISAVREDISEIRHVNSDSNGTAVVENRRHVDFGAFIGKAKGNIRVTGFSANDLLAVPNCDLLYHAIEEGRVQKVRIKLLDPECEAAKVRATQPAYQNTRSVKAKFAAVISEIEDLSIRLQNAGFTDILEWQLLSEPVTVSLVADDTTLIVTPVIRTRTGGTSPTLTFERGRGKQSPFFDVYIEHFESLGAASDPNIQPSRTGRLAAG